MAHLPTRDTAAHLNRFVCLAARHDSPLRFLLPRFDDGHCVGNVDFVHVGRQFVFFGLFETFNVDFPAREFGGKSRVLTFFADCKAELIVGDDHATIFVFVADGNADNLRRAERVGNKNAGLRAPFDDVKFLVAKFVHDGLNSHAALTDARTDRVNVGVFGNDGDFRARTRFTSHAANFDDAFLNFGHFNFNQPTQKRGMCSRQINLRTFAAFLTSAM